MNTYLKVIPGKFAHLNELSIRSFDCMVLRSFHTPSRYDFHSNVIRPSFPIQRLSLILLLQGETSCHFDTFLVFTCIPLKSIVNHSNMARTIKMEDSILWKSVNANMFLYQFQQCLMDSCLVFTMRDWPIITFQETTIWNWPIRTQK